MKINCFVIQLFCIKLSLRDNIDREFKFDYKIFFKTKLNCKGKYKNL